FASSSENAWDTKDGKPEEEALDSAPPGDASRGPSGPAPKDVPKPVTPAPPQNSWAALFKKPQPPPQPKKAPSPPAPVAPEPLPEPAKQKEEPGEPATEPVTEPEPATAAAAEPPVVAEETQPESEPPVAEETPAPEPEPEPEAPVVEAT